jgi:PTH1 family peptidyl-tRNA hydrolase
MHLVLGLGNPGRRYDTTRHNIGFLVVDGLAARCNEGFRGQLGAQVCKVRLADRDVVLAKPQSFMNLSGQPTVSLRGYYKVAEEDLLVVHDDVDIPFGQVRIKRGGGHGGHNGLRDILAKLGAAGFVRIRVGVSRPPPGWDTARYVLAPWAPEEERDLPGIVDRASDAVTAVVRDGATSAMNQFNTRPREDAPPGSSGPRSPTDP